MSSLVSLELQQPLAGSFQSGHVLLAPGSESLSENAMDGQEWGVPAGWECLGRRSKS